MIPEKRKMSRSSKRQTSDPISRRSGAPNSYYRRRTEYIFIIASIKEKGEVTRSETKDDLLPIMKYKLTYILSSVVLGTSKSFLLLSNHPSCHLHKNFVLSIHQIACRHRSSKLSLKVPNSDLNSTAHHLPDGAIVTFETLAGKKEIQVQKGEILRSALLKRGISPHNGRSRLINCRGLGTCGTCAVEVTSDDNQPSIIPIERSKKERLRLNFPPHGSKEQSTNLRLACQIQVQGDINVKKRTGFWGQDTSGLAEEYESELWFGDLEYILDDKSPKNNERE